MSKHWLALSSQSDTLPILTPDNRGLAYGDGFFTTMAVVDGKVLWQEYHQQRLTSHAQALQLSVDSAHLLEHIQIQAEQLQQGMMKLIVTRAPQSMRGYGFSAGSACDVWLKATAMPIETTEQVILPNGDRVLMQPATNAICLTAQLACLPPSLAGLKSLNRLDNVLASGELEKIKSHNVDYELGEGLLRDMSGHWVEGVMSNVFYQLSDVKKTNAAKSMNGSTYLTSGHWYTPSMNQSGVAGVMRQVLIDVLATTNTPVIIRTLSDKDLPRLSQLFFCNAVRGIMPVSTLTLLNGEIIRLL